MTSAPTFYKTTFPPIDLEENIQTKLLVAQSPTEIRYVTYPATSFSQSNCVFNIIPPSPQVIISRLVRLQVPVTIQINATLNTAGFPSVQQANVFNTLYAGFADFPIHKSIATLTLILNNQSTTIRPSQIIDKLLYYCMGEDLVSGTMSQTPSLLDQTFDYDQGLLSITSPFAMYGDSQYHISRNSFPISFASNAVITPSSPNGSATLNATFTEPLMISPLIFDENWYIRPGITQITQFLVNITWDTQALQRIIRHAQASDPSTWNSVTVTLGQPQLILGYYTLPSYMVIPPMLSYNYSQVQNFIYQPGSTINAGASATLITNNVQFQSIPRRVYFAVQRTNRSITDADSFLPITQISLTWMNTSGILSTLGPQDLYLVSRKNGLVISWTQASGQRILLYNGGTSKTFNGTGFPLCLEFGCDIQLSNETYVGMQGTFNFMAQITATNYTSTNLSVELHMIVIYDGFMTINNQNVTLNTGLLKPEQGFSIPSLVKMPFPHLTDFYMGGAFSLGNLLQGIGSHLFSGIKGLLSGLIFGEQKGAEGEQSADISRNMSALLPYIQKMMGSRRNIENKARRSIREQIEEEDED